MLDLKNTLVPARDILAGMPSFSLVGRDKELTELSSVLMRMKKHNLIVTGRAGVGISTILIGIESRKSHHKTPLEIIGKKFYWLNSDSLFESGSSKQINTIFTKVRQSLKSRNSVLVIEDSIDFIQGARNNGCYNLINALMGDLKSNNYQAIFETSDNNLGELLSIDGDILEFCSLREVKEPSKESLEIIVNNCKKDIEKHFRIQISEKAIQTAIELTEKYKLSSLRAQPDAAISLLDIAMTDLCHKAQSDPGHISQLKKDLEKAESEEERNKIQERLNEEEIIWRKLQEETRVLYRDICEGESQIQKLEQRLDEIKEEQKHRIDRLEVDNSQEASSIATRLANSNLDTPESAEIKTRIDKFVALVEASTEAYKAKTEKAYENLSLSENDVLKTFSALSSIPVETLGEDEKTKLKNLDNSLASRVIGQEEPTQEVAKAVKRARLGLKMPNKPSGTFMFLGPSGVGKTELAKALSDALGVSLLRFDMSEYMEKHAVSKLIGAPPGYEGYEHGGVLTNSVRENPYSVILFDEIEKAHPDVFNIMLQLLDDARLTDSRGLTASFKDVIVIMTTNIGTHFFLDSEIDFEDAKTNAHEELYSHYRPEFLGRFGGNIYCFRKLNIEVLKIIASKEIKRIEKLLRDREIKLSISEQELEELIKFTYVPREGARSILGYIDRNITSSIADKVLESESKNMSFKISFDSKTKLVTLQ